VSVDADPAVARVGLISDTHGKLDARVHKALAGVDAIVHAGDIGRDSILFELQAIAPEITAVLGNCDFDDYAWALRLEARATYCGVRLLVVHDLHTLEGFPSDVDIVVCGHSHKPSVTYHGRVLVVNPGSASQRRSEPSRSVAVLEIRGQGLFGARIIALDDIAPPPSRR
jgi:putative phosphoesterase